MIELSTLTMISYLRQIPTEQITILALSEPLEQAIVFADQLFFIIDGNLANSQFTVRVLAQQMYISERQLRRRCKSLTRLSPNQIIVEVRLYYAQQLLLQTIDYKTVVKISERVGFSTPDYFSRLFTQRFGVKPSTLFPQE